jgi:hypothetical protein
MNKTRLAAIGSLIPLIAAPAVASTVALGPYKNHGDCNSALAWAAYDARKGSGANWPAGKLSCALVNASWYIVVG